MKTETQSLYEKCVEELDSMHKMLFHVGENNPDSYQCGTLVEKTDGEDGDITPLGTPGIVLGCRDVTAEYAEVIKESEHKAIPEVKYFYLIAFIHDNEQKIKITCILDYKIKQKQ